MATTYSPIATTTLGTAAASVTFSTISGAYTDLVLVVNGYLATQDAAVPRLEINGSTSNVYSQTNLTGTGATAKSTRFTDKTDGFYIGSNDIGWSTTAGNRSTNIIQIMNYSNTTTYKTIIGRTNQPAGSYPGVEAEVGLFRSTSAITSLRVFSSVATFATGSTFTLYGIKAA